MLDRLKKTFGNLLASRETSATEPEDAVEEPEEASAEDAEKANDLEAVLLARRDAQKREQRLILAERIHNRATVLTSEARTELVQNIHRMLSEEVQDPSLHNLLQVTLDSAFTAKLDANIDSLLDTVLVKLRSEFTKDADASALLPPKEALRKELALYRDEIVRKHLLEQVEVRALPTLAQAFPEGDVTPEQLKQRISEYWASCRDALDKFFRSVEMVLLDGARDGIRLDSNLIRERLVAAQYRNGYRLLDDRFRNLYGEIATLLMGTTEQEDKRSRLDRKVVDEIVVPLAYFIRERTESEPRVALAGRAELFREIVDKLVAIPEPFQQSAEAVKPVLRRSIEQARPLVSEDFPYLKPVIDSLNPAAIHRTTALLKLFETLVTPELDEKTLEDLEQVIRLNRAQYRLYLQVNRAYPGWVRRLRPYDRIGDDDANFLATLIEDAEPPIELIEDLALHFGYLDWPDPLPPSPRRLLQLIAALTLPAREMTSWSTLYLDEAPTSSDRARLAQAVLAQIGPSSDGADERRTRLKAAPFPIDLNKTLATIGYQTRIEAKERAGAFRDELKSAVETGDAEELAEQLVRLRSLGEAAEAERVTLGATGIEADPYRVEIWLQESGTMVGLVVYKGNGFGSAPVEVLSRDPGTGNRKELEEKLRRQLQTQALIYQRFHRLFSLPELLLTERRRSLPAFVKTLYEPTESNRHLLLSRLRYAKELMRRIDSFAKLILEASSQAAEDVKAVVQILGGLDKKVDQLAKETEKNPAPSEIARLVKEYERVLKYLNTAVLHAINPWLRRQTADLATEFDFNKDDVRHAVQQHTSLRGLDWERDVVGFEAHGIRGTMGCRALIQLGDGSSKVVLLNYDRRRQCWQVRHLGPRITDVVREALRQRGKTLPSEYDEKYEQPTFSLDEQSCRFLYVKRDVARIESTLVLDPALEENPWRVVYLKYNDSVLVDRSH